MSNKLFKLADLFEKKVRKFAQDAQNAPQKMDPAKSTKGSGAVDVIREALKGMPKLQAAIQDRDDALKVVDARDELEVKFKTAPTQATYDAMQKLVTDLINSNKIVRLNNLKVKPV
jgi:hypothetical protein